jgi:hypothetical protein
MVGPALGTPEIRFRIAWSDGVHKAAVGALMTPWRRNRTAVCLPCTPAADPSPEGVVAMAGVVQLGLAVASRPVCWGWVQRVAGGCARRFLPKCSSLVWILGMVAVAGLPPSTPC